MIILHFWAPENKVLERRKTFKPVSNRTLHEPNLMQMINTCEIRRLTRALLHEGTQAAIFVEFFKEVKMTIPAHFLPAKIQHLQKYERKTNCHMRGKSHPDVTKAIYIKRVHRWLYETEGNQLP